MEPEMKPTRMEKLMNALQQRPELFAQIEALVAEVGAEQGGSLDQAEAVIVQRLRSLGRGSLETWMRERAARAPVPPEARRSAKKKSGA
jgi:hypothetical protein